LSNQKTTVETPWGEISYSGKLDENTQLKMPNGKEIPFYSLISHTQGDCLAYFVEPATPKPAKVTKSLEEALADVKLEWIEE
jgi:hypothetical protein